MTTKERILEKALALFAEKGYHAVFVGDIAAAVGIRAPSLYKHFKSKQAIFDACVERFSERMNEVRNGLLPLGGAHPEEYFKTAGLRELSELAEGLFLFYLKDAAASDFRRMLLLERARDPELNRLYEEIFMDGAVAYEEKAFAELIGAGVLKQADPHTLALRFYSPVYFLLQKYDLHPEREEEAKRELGALVAEFSKIYGILRGEERER